MTRNTVLRSLALALCFATPALFAQDAGAPPQEKKAPPSVGAHMEQLEAAMEIIVPYVQTFEGDAPMAELDKALKALQASKQQAPKTARRQPEDKRAEFIKAYRIAINVSIRAMLDLEDAILAKDKDAAMAALKKVSAAKKAGHNTYKGRRRR